MIVTMYDIVHGHRREMETWQCSNNTVNSSIYSKIIEELRNQREETEVTKRITRKIISMLDEAIANKAEWDVYSALATHVSDFVGVGFIVTNHINRKTMHIAANELNMLKLKYELI